MSAGGILLVEDDKAFLARCRRFVRWRAHR
jgi:hypothetical protein